MPSYDQSIPDFANLTGAASSNIKSLLAGQPSADQARLDNAWYGAGTGLDPTSPFLINRGRGLYGAEAEQRKQTGLENFLNMLKSFSGSVVPTTGQQEDARQFDTRFNYGVNQDTQNRNDILSAENQQFQEGRANDWERSNFLTAGRNSQNWLAGPNSAPSFMQQWYPQFMNWAKMAGAAPAEAASVKKQKSSNPLY